MVNMPTSLNTTSEIIRYGEICQGAGIARAQGMWATTSYQTGLLTYADFYEAITTCNDFIRGYNLMVKGLFNETTSTGMILDEFGL